MSEPLRVRRPGVRAARPQPVAAPTAPATPQPAAAAPAWSAGPVFGLGAVQLKPVIGAPDDAYEKEADDVATRVSSGLPAPGGAVSRLSGPAAQRASAEDEDVQLKAEDDDAVQLKAEEDEACACGGGHGCSCGDVQRMGDAAATPAMQNAAATAIQAPSAGSTLPPATRGTLETRMGVDLGGVRVHTGPVAHDAAARLEARAFTHRNHIWLAEGESPNDVPLMAHETTHVLQQDGVVRRQPAAAPPAPAAPAAPTPAPAQGPAGELLMPPPPEDLSPEERARLAAVEQRAADAVDATTALPAGDEQVGEARQAVQEPAEETAARAQDGLVEALGERPEPSPEIEELCERIRTVIREKRPPDEDSLVRADPQAMAQDAGTQMNSSVEGDTQRVQGEYGDLESPPEGAPVQEAVPMAETPGPAEAGDLAATTATPDGVSAEAVSLDADVAASSQQIEDAGMTTEPAQLVEDGPIADARAAHGELSETAARDPQEVLAEQQAVLASAQGDMAALQAAALEALQGGRAQTTAGGRAQQTAMVGSEEQMRTQASAEAQQIFASAQSRVSALLEPLPRTAMAKWDAGVQVLSTRFEQRLAEVKRWVDERHESTVLAVVDYFTGLPAWVTRAYDGAEQDFGDGVCALITEVSTEVNGVIAACEAIIDTARTDIDAVFAALPEELQGWAAEQQAEFDGRLDGLQQQAHDAQASFTSDLVQRASQAVQSVREQVHALREAAKGLIGQIADAINAFLEDPARFIIEGLLRVLGIAPSAFWAVVDRIGAAIDSIADDPMNFVNNLMAALGQGFTQFFDNFGQHMLQGFMDWLFSGLGAVGVQIPSDMSIRSIITFFLQLMGLTWPNIREILVRHIGEENVALVEKAWELISALIEMGPEGLFEMVKEQLDPANILSMVIDAAVDYLIEALIRAVTPRIIGLFNPAGAILQAIEAIYRVLNWIFQNAARIFSLVETVVNGVTDLIAGNISGMANAVEGALARLITPVIDFLAGYLGLGDLPDKIADVIRGFQQQVLAVVDRIIGFLAERARALLRALGFGGEEDEGEEEITGNHDDIAAQAKREMERPASDAHDYESLRQAKEAQAEAVEQRYSAALEEGVGLRVQFADATADKADEDLDFTITIAPNDTTTTGSVPVPDESLQLTKSLFGDRLFAESELAAEWGADSAPGYITAWKQQGELHQVGRRSRAEPPPAYPLFSFNAQKADASSYSGRRSDYGYENPDKGSQIGLRVLLKGLFNGPPPGISIFDRSWHEKHGQYRSIRSGVIMGFDTAILGHHADLGASDHWNQQGHTQNRAQNLAWNRDPNSYAGPETAAESAATGSRSALYRIPAQVYGSSASWL